MGLADIYSSPLEWETEEEKRQRESNRFKTLISPVLQRAQEYQNMANTQAETVKFREKVKPVLSANDELQKFRQKVQSMGGGFTSRETGRLPSGAAMPSTIQPGYKREEIERQLDTGTRPTPEERAKLRAGEDRMGFGDLARMASKPFELETRYVGRPVTEALLTANRAAMYPAEQIPVVGPRIERAREAIEPVQQFIGENTLVPSNLLPGIGFGDELAKAGKAVARGPAGRATGRLGKRLMTEEVGGTKLPGEGYHETERIWVRDPDTGESYSVPRPLTQEERWARLSPQEKLAQAEEAARTARASGGQPPREPPITPQGGGVRAGGFGGAGKPPMRSSALDVEPEDVTTPLGKLTLAVKAAGRATPEQRAMFAQQRAQRTAEAARALQKGVAEGDVRSGFAGARGALSDEFARPQFDVPQFTEADATQLLTDIGKADAPFYDKLSAQQAFDDLSRGRIPEPARMAALKRVFPQGGEELVKALQSKRPWSAKLGEEILSIPGLSMALKASFDMGTRFRQSLVLGFTHPRQWLSNWKPTANALFSEDSAQSLARKLESNPWYSIQSGENAGLGFRDVGGHLYDWQSFTPGPERVAGFTGMNDTFLSRAVQRVPGIRGSERAFAMDLNKAGVEVYAQEAQAMWKAGVRDPDMYKALASVINHARGYGAFNPGQIAKGVNTFFSGRNLVAKFQVVLDPLTQPGSLLKTSPRQLAAKNLAGMIAGDLSLLGFLGAVGALTGVGSVEFNPLKPGADWLKFRVGNTRIDPWGGFLPMARLIARMGAATATETGLAKTKYDMNTVKRDLGTFFENKEAPMVRLFTDLAGISQPFEPRKLSPKILVDLYAPFVAEDVWDAVKQEDWTALAAVPSLSMVGVGIQSYTTPSEVFLDAFKKTTGQDFDSQAGDRKLAESDPSLSPLYKAWREDQLERGVESATQTKKRADFLAQEEKDLRIPDLAQGIVGGNQAMMPEFAKRFENLQAAAAIVPASDLFGVDIETSDDPRAVAYRSWAEVTPYDTKYIDPDTGQVDWESYKSDKKTALSKLDPRLQAIIEKQTISTDGNAKTVELRLKASKKDAEAYYEIPKYKGLSVEQGEQVDEALRAIDFIATKEDLRQTSGRVLSRRGGRVSLSDEEAPFDRRAAFNLIKDRVDPSIAQFVERNFLPRQSVRSLGKGRQVTSLSEDRDVQDPRRDQWALSHPDLIYFGLVQVSTLSRTQKQGLDTRFLGRNVSPQLVR